VAALLAVLATTLVLIGAVGCKSDEPETAGSTGTAAGATSPEATTAGSTAPADDEAPSGGGSAGFAAIPEIVRRVEPSVVAVLVQTELASGEGSGVIWDADGLIVTNNHVVEGAREVMVAFASGERLRARVVDTDALSDLAVLRVDRDGLPAARFAEELPQVGELAVAIGNPLGFESTVTAGIVSGLHRSIPAGGLQAQSLVDLIQTDAAISPGNSGGALVDGEGRVMGINVAYIPPEARAVSIGFAIPAATVVSAVEQLLESGEVSHSYLGIRGPTTLTPEIAEEFGLETDRGVLVAGVDAGTPAAEAGLEQGDIIVRAGGTRTDATGDLLGLLRRVPPGETLELVIVRDGEEMTVRAELAERPADLEAG
jgi:S1-C subfamily serine protease